MRPSIRAFKKRLRAMYENDSDHAGPDFLLQKPDEFSDRIQAESAIAKSDKKIIERLSRRKRY